MTLLKLALYFISLELLGWLAWRAWHVRSNQGLVWQLVMAWAIGTLAAGWQLYVWFFWCHGHGTSSFLWLFLAEAAALGSLAYYRGWRPRWPRCKWRRWANGSLLFAVLLALQLTFSLANALARPVLTYDALAIWSSRAKALYTAQAIDFKPQDYFYLGGLWHNNYPWQVPLLEYYLDEVVGYQSDTLINLIFVAYWLALVGLIAVWSCRRLGRTLGLGLTALFISLPLVFYHSFNAYADLPLAFYVGLAFAWLVDYLRQGRPGQLAVALGFLAGACLVKLEGLLYLLAALPSWWLAARSRQQTWWYWLVVLVLPLPWLLFILSQAWGLANIGGGLGWHPQILPVVLQAVFLANSWNIWWYAWLVCLVIFWSRWWRISFLRYSGLYLILVAGAFAGLYLLTDEYNFVLNNTAFSRNLLTFVPLTFLYLAALWPDSQPYEIKHHHPGL